MSRLEDLCGDREVQQTILLAYRRKLAREATAVCSLSRAMFPTERAYREARAELEAEYDATAALIVRSEALIADYADAIVDAWVDEHTTKPTDIPEPWAGGAA